MKEMLINITFFLVCISAAAVSRAQNFNEQIFYEYREMYPHHHAGNIYNINDTLAFIEFTGPYVGENFSFACRFKFRNDTLYMDEIKSAIDLNHHVEYSFSSAWHPDSVYLGVPSLFCRRRTIKLR